MSLVISDSELMQVALREAEKSQSFNTHPNPRVGAALRSRDGKVVAGHHSRSGLAHAEAEVLKMCAEQNIATEGSTIAVTLEPCSHFGKTPPCADALIRAGVSRVLYALKDPHPKVSGEGARRLATAGIEVHQGLCGSEAFALNREWLTAHRTGRPFVRIKIASSLDGLMASEAGESQWITGPLARREGMELRARSQLVITGTGSVRRDNPRMTVRDLAHFGDRPQPLLWVLSRDSQFSAASYLVNQHPRFGGVKDGSSLFPLLKEAYSQDIFEVLIEAGPRLLHSFLSEGLFDEVHWFVASKVLGGQGARLPAFLNGKLPGLELKTKQLTVLDEHNHLLILEKN